MEIGVKLFADNYDLAHRLDNRIDYIELMALQEYRDYLGKFRKLRIPIKVIHCEHMAGGVNVSNKSRRDINEKALKFSQDVASLFDSRFIIIHPGVMENKRCSFGNMIDFFKDIKDSRVITENLPYKGTYSGKFYGAYGRSPDEMRRITKSSGIGFCLDFGHSWTYAFAMKRDPVDVAIKFMQLNPSMYHFYDGIRGETTDSHRSIGSGNMNLRDFKQMLPDDAMVTLETVPDYNKLIKDIEFMR